MRPHKLPHKRPKPVIHIPTPLFTAWSFPRSQFSPYRLFSSMSPLHNHRMRLQKVAHWDSLVWTVQDEESIRGVSENEDGWSGGGEEEGKQAAAVSTSVIFVLSTRTRSLPRC